MVERNDPSHAGTILLLLKLCCPCTGLATVTWPGSGVSCEDSRVLGSPRGDARRKSAPSRIRARRIRPALLRRQPALCGPPGQVGSAKICLLRFDPTSSPLVLMSWYSWQPQLLLLELECNLRMDYVVAAALELHQ